MSKKYTAKRIKLDELVLDKENPRFAELYNGSDKEEEIIEYLLWTESANEIAEAITTAEEYYDDRPLWVYKDNGKYIVKDGNRRCSAVKALQHPNYYKLSHPKFEIKELPVLEYKELNDLETRIRLEHNSNLFKKWGRIAKAIEIYRLFSSGNSIDSLTEIDSKPKDFIKTATFYHKAVELKGEDFKKLVREGRGKTGGKTIIFERLFRERKHCGYSFKNSGELFIKNKELFESYINAIVPYLIDNPDTTSRTLDEIYKKGNSFLDLLKPYGFPPDTKPSTTNSNSSSNSSSASSSNSSNNGNNTNDGNDGSNGQSTNNSQNNNSSTNTNSGGSSNNQNTTNTRHSVKSKPALKRKQIPSALKRLIEETYKLDQNNFANAKTALTRVSFECTLKFIVENTNKTNGKPINTSNHFALAYKSKSHKPLPYTNFDILKTKFTELITNTGIRKAFEDFDLQRSHQIIHNYRVGAVPADAKGICDNLIDLIEFMLQDENDLLNSIDLAKL
ncbi:hypothetical protein JL193_01625 [Polaribacter batillariae]|uniref:ParB/Sulfiredoxin domain-containing protein n=1 Tax=Polaribacter batillariae TaxID=2808900 RepID=A0ABX7SUX2_9FLAO|nr:hypothetical protein [Polaribacter batillariae]QTD38030.1 hypothetical protein JL193_01625 [Polaribacter batillariae]